MTDITQPIRDALVEIIVADSGKEMMQARYEFDKTCTPAALTALLARLDAAELDAARYRHIALLIGSIFFHGDFKAETYNERELEKCLRDVGCFWETQQAMKGKP